MTMPQDGSVQPVLPVRDAQSALSLYERIGFGSVFVDSEAGARYGVVSRDGTAIHLQWHDASEWEALANRPVLRFLVRDVDALHAEFTTAGVTERITQPMDTALDAREFHL